VSTPHVDAAAGAEPAALTLAKAVARLAEAEDTLRAIGAGEVDAFVVSDGGTGRRVFTLSTADRTYRRFVESMRDGAATISSSGLILFANQRLAALLSSSVETLVGSPLAMFVAGGVPEWDMTHGPGGLGATVELDLVDSSGATVPVLAGASPLEVDGDDLTCVTFADLSVQKAQEREIARSEAQAERMVELQDAETALTEQATHDALTGLPNRGLLFDAPIRPCFTRNALDCVPRSCSSISTSSSRSMTHADMRRETPCCRRSPTGWPRFFGPWTLSRASAAMSSSSSHPTSPASSTRST